MVVCIKLTVSIFLLFYSDLICLFLVTYPLDITKTRLQTHAVPGIIKKQSGMLRVTYNIGKKHISKKS